MEQIIYLLVGGALTWAFYFVKRRTERRGTVDAIERNQKLLELLQGLEGADISLDELRGFETRLIDKAETAARTADRYFTRAEQVARHSEVQTISQAEIDRLAVESYRRADARVGDLVEHLRAQLDGEPLARFERAHAAWLEFRERYAGFIAECYSGGAIRPLIDAVTLESISWAWVAELEAQLGEEAFADDDE